MTRITFQRNVALELDGKPGKHTLPYLSVAIRLMGCCERMRAYLAVLRHEPATTVERINANIISYAAIAEGGEICAVMRKATQQASTRHTLHRDMLTTAADKMLWDEIFRDPPSPRVMLMRRLRDKHIAHTDVDMVDEFVQKYVWSKSDTIPIVETWSKGGFYDTIFNWYHAACLFDVLQQRDLTDGDLDRETILKKMNSDVWEEQQELQLAVWHLASNLVTGLISACGMGLKESKRPRHW